VYYAYATQSGTTQVQTIRSPDLAHWEWVGEALPRLPSWAAFGYLWGPSVLARPTGYVLYYATRQAATQRQCISLAVSLLPQGPFVDTSDRPFICQLERGGSIDPSPFVDADGAVWLTWKSEGTLAGEPTRVWAQRLSADGRALQGQPSELVHTDQPWELPLVEGPSLSRVGGRYVLAYAGNRWETSGYAIG
jgi:beta-xylosidase